MKFAPFKLFTRRPMGFKLTIVFVSIVLVPMLLLAYISFRVVDSRLLDHAREEITSGMKAAWTEYYMRGEQMRYGMLQAASMDEIRAAVARRDAEYLRKMMSGWKQMRPYVDLWAVTDQGGKVIARINSHFQGDTIGIDGLLQQAMASKEPQMSTELLSESLLKVEGNELNEKLALPSAEKGRAADISSKKPGVLALMVITPVLDDSHRPIGAIVTADVLNNDSFVPDMVSYKLPGVFTTISSGGTRVSTNIMGTDGRNAKGTALEPDAVSMLSAGQPVFREVELPGLTLISRFEPIRDFRGRVIGSLDVGISKEKTWAIQKENQQVIAVITILGLSFSILAALVSTYKITGPLKELKDKLSAYGSGDANARVTELAESGEEGDEISTLAKAFNRMANEVSLREAEKEKYLKEIENKNKALSELNEELRITNEELEVAYEETQSQTEELHAINEELRLLNEDLDRKNLELQNANRVITQEEKELKSAKNKLRLIYDGIRDYLLLVDGDCRILEANRFFFEKTGLPEQAAIGKDIYSVFGIDPPQNCPIRKSLESFTQSELELASSEGKVFVAQSYPLDGVQKGAVVCMHDVTERRLMAQKLMQADKLSSLGELVSGVAHELNNPLTGIMCFSELLLEERLGESANSKLRKINDASHRCKRIIENLLTFARWKRPEKQYGDLNRIIRDSVEFRSYQLKVDNIEVGLDLEEALPWTMVDSHQIQQVFLNLINNARDAIKEKGPSGRIKITSRYAGGRIIISVEDTGKGISEDIAGRIFDPFFTTKEVGKGTGLGLSISYGIINEHGGNIYASSRNRVGTTFMVEIPVIESAGSATVPSVSAEPRICVDQKKALLLDDEHIVLDLLADTLASFGFEVDKCSAAEDALMKLALADYDLIVSDIKMPGLDGKAFFREVQALKPSMLKKIVFVSGDSMNRETQEFLAEAGSPSLKKPFTIDELSEIVSRILL